MELVELRLTFNTVDTEDGHVIPEIALFAEQGGDRDLLNTYTPEHEPYEAMEEPGPEGHSWMEVAQHESEYEDAIIETLGEISAHYEGVIKAIMSYHRAGGDLIDLKHAIFNMD